MTSPCPKRRFFRYSLRTLMLLVTLFCIWMGITAKRARDQRQAVEVIRELKGGDVSYEHEDANAPSEPPGPEWMRKLIGNEYFFTVYDVTLVGPKVNDLNVTTIKRLTDMKRLTLNGTQITDAGLVNLKGLTNLETLWLTKNQITDTGLEHLKGLTSLQHLWLNKTKITDAGLRHLTGLANLVILDLSGTQVTDEGVNKLQQALPNCPISYSRQ